MTGLERSQNDIRRHRASAEDVVADGIRDGGEHRAKAGSHRWLADAARTDWRFRIGNIERRVLHEDGNVQYGQRLVVMKPRLQRHTVVLVVHGFLCERVTDSQTAAAENLATETAWVDDGTDVGDGRVINELHRSGLDVDLHFREPDDVRVRFAVVRIRVFRDAHQPEASERAR